MSDDLPATATELVALDYLDWLALLNPSKAPDYYAEPKRLPSSDEYRKLVEEVALGYFTEDELCQRFSIPKDMFQKIRKHPAFMRDVLTVQKEQDGDDASLRVLARRQTRDAVRSLQGILEDGESTHNEKVKAVEQLRQLAGLGATEGKDKSGMTIPLQINTNLSLNDTPGQSEGRYVIQSKPVEDDFDDLLGGGE